MSEKSIFSHPHHLALVVHDTDKAIAHFESLGIGPFVQGRYLEADIKLRGKAIPKDYFTRKEFMGKMGQIMLQLIQPGEEDSPWKEFLETKGEGVHHLGFLVDDIDKAEADLGKKGFEVIMSSRFKIGGGAAYIDIGKPTGGILAELIQIVPT